MTNAFSKMVAWVVDALAMEEMTINKDVKGLYSDGMCFFNAEHNRLNAFKHLGLKWVVGGVGMNGWFEYGGKKGYKYDNWNDSHAWLEDAEGKVYDYCQPSWAYYCRMNGASTDLPYGVEFRGVSKQELRDMGLDYCPAEPKHQRRIRERAFNPVMSTVGIMMSLVEGWKPQPLRRSVAGY